MRHICYVSDTSFYNPTGEKVFQNENQNFHDILLPFTYKVYTLYYFLILNLTKLVQSQSVTSLTGYMSTFCNQTSKIYVFHWMH